MIPGYKVVKKKPKAGQFLVIWIFEDKIFSDTMLIKDGVEYMWINELDDWDTEFAEPNRHCDIYYMVRNFE